MYKPFATPGTAVELGRLGELHARDYLRSEGYSMVVSNFIAPIGRGRTGRVITAEIDLIAYDRDSTLCFVEVKTRSSRTIAPEFNVDLAKRRKIIRVARIYRRVMGLFDEPFRYDVISILAIPGEPFEVEHLKNYFTEHAFQASEWIKKC